MAEEKSNDYISLQGATEYCSYTQEYLSLRARQGKLKAVKIGRNWLTKKEWVKEYIERVEEYNNNLKANNLKEKKLVPPPKNLPVEEIARVTPVQLRPALVIALVFVLLIAGVVSGKESLRNVYQDLEPYTYIVGQAGDIIIESTAKILSETISDIPHSLANVSETIDNTQRAIVLNLLPASEGLAQVTSPDVLKSTFNTFKEFGHWFSENLKNGARTFSLAFKNFTQGIRKIPRAITGLFKRETKKEIVIEKPEEKEYAQKEDLEKLQKELKELKEKPEKVIEVSKITKVEPIKEITKETRTLDDESLKRIQATLLQQETDVGKLQLTASRGYINLPPSVGPSGAVSLTTLGTITAGSWQAGSIEDAYVVDDLTIASSKAGSFSYSGTSPALTITQSGAGQAVLIDNIQIKTGTISTDSGDLTLDSNSGSINISGKAIFSKAPTQAHTGAWAIGSLTWNQDDAPIYINPVTATADSNLLGLAVNNSVKFAIDAEGDIYGNNLILEGSSSIGTTTIAGDLSVEGNTIIGDATTDTLTINPATLTLAGGDKTIDITGVATRTLMLLNSNASQVADLDLSDGSLKTGGTSRLTNSGLLENITGLSSSGTITFSGLTADRPVITTTGGQLTTEAQLAIARGGTAGTASPTAGAIAYGTGSAYAFSAAGTTDYALISGGTGAPTWTNTPSWSTITLSTSVTSPTIYGSSAASGNLTLRTTSDATKGSYILSELTSNGFVKTSGGTGTLSIDTTSYQPAGTYVTSVSGTSPITSSGGTTPAIGITQTSITNLNSALATGLLKITTGTGLLSIAAAGTDYQAPGDYITALTGEVTATGPGSVAATIASQTSATWLGKVSDATGTGKWVFGTSPVFTTQITSPLIYLNATATLDGSVAGLISVVGSISTLSNGILTLLPNGTGYTRIGDAGTTSHTFNTNDDLLVSGRLEVNGVTYFDGEIYTNDTAHLGEATVMADGKSYVMGDGYDAGLGWSASEAADTARFYLGTDSKSILFVDYANRGKNHDHANQANPTIIIHSATDPDTDNTQWLSLTHDQTNGVISTGKGDLILSPTGNVGIGTTSPATRLDVRFPGYDSGNAISIGSVSGGSGGEIGTSAGTGFPLTIWGHSGNDLALGADGTEKMRILQNGNVGIGTAAPSYKLDVSGTTNTRELIAHDISLSSLSTSILTAQFGFDGYTNFSGGIGTGGIGKDSILGAQRLTSTGNLINIGSIQAGEMLLTNGGTFVAKVDYTTGTAPYSVAIGDLDGDNKADLAVVNRESPSLSVFINDGGGTFAAKVDYTTGDYPNLVAIGDLNGDGAADLALVSDSNTLSVFINNGDGTFVAKVDYTTGDSPKSVAIGDINGDGKADLAVANFNSTSVSIFINNGDGTFAAKVDYTTGDNPNSVAIGDVNGDGKADLAVANLFSVSVSVFLNDGDGTFAAKVDYTTGTWPFSVAIGDLDNDGQADLAVINAVDNTVSVFLNDGDGTFAAKVDYATGVYPKSVAIGDVNGNGKADLAVANVTDNDVSVFINDGDGTFAAKVDYTTGTSPISVAIGDVNGDGKADLAVANADSTSVSVLINNASPIFYAQASSGNVGIGTASPGQALHIKRTDDAAIQLETSATASDNTGFKSPTAEGDDYTDWTEPTYVYIQDDYYAYPTVNDQQHDFYNFSFNVPADASISGIEAKLVMTRSASPGSCPFLYLGDGTNYNYYTDLAGESLGGSWFETPLYEAGIYELGNFGSTDGIYKLKVREVIPESDFFDEARLVLVDVPNGYSVLNTWHNTYSDNVTPAKDFVTVKDPKVPVSAIDKYGNNVLSSVSDKDGIPLKMINKEPNSVIVDFGEIENPQYAKLVISGWSSYELNQKLSSQNNLIIETLDSNGNWQVAKKFGKFTGDEKTFVFNIPNILQTNNTKMRISAPYSKTTINIIDQVLLDDSAPVDFNVTYLDPSYANLHWGGSINYQYPTTGHRNINVTDEQLPNRENFLMYGNYTKYGNVLPLLEKTDDMYAIMRHGDELSLEFEDIPKVQGQDRHVFMLADVMYSIKYSVKGFVSDTIEPLPFHGMSQYPYDTSVENYPNDADHNDYRAEYNTRVYTAPPPPAQDPSTPPTHHTIYVDLSHDGGTTYATYVKEASTATEGVWDTVTLGGSTDTWGRSWTAGEFLNTNFRLRFAAGTLGALVDIVDLLQVKVYYSYTPNWVLGIDQDDSGYFKISGSSALGTSDFLTIDYSGRVGIGTASPNNLFQVQDLINFDEATYSTLLGYQAGYSNTTGNYDTALGYKALYSNTTGKYNTALGALALYSNTTGKYNTALGDSALYSNTTGEYNTALGDSALYSNTTGYSNTALGGFALFYNTSGYHNIAIGESVLPYNTTGFYNIALGEYALYSNTTGYSNIAIGESALSASNGNYNTALGRHALASATTSYYNTALGDSALYSNTTGNSNTALGADALYSNTTGFYNIALGHQSLYHLIGSYHNNTALGYHAGMYQADGINGLTTPSQSIYIGSGAMGYNNSDVNSIVIGYLAKGIGANSVVLGNDSITTTALKGNVGIGTTSPDARLQITGGGLCVGSDVNCGTDNNTEGYVYASSTAMTVYDVAENYPTKDETLGAGEVVSLDKDNAVFVKHSSSAYDSNLVGVISTEPAVLLGGFKTFQSQFKNEIQVPVTLSGRVPVKVSLENGPIEIGDYLTSSNIPGVAMKATEPGRVIGMALENFDGLTPDVNPSTSGVGKIMVFVNPHWSLGSLSDDGSLASGDLTPDVSASSTSGVGEISILDQFTLAIKKSLEKLGLFVENGIAKIKELVAEKITAKKLCLEGDDGKTICIDKNQLKELVTKNQTQGINSSSGSSGGGESDGSTGGLGDGSDDDLGGGGEPPPQCDATHLNLCDNEEKCNTVGGIWDSNTCNQKSEPQCEPNWQPSDWESAANPDTLQCGESVTQTRTYTDTNECGVSEGKPADETQELKGTYCEQGNCDLEKGECQVPAPPDTNGEGT